jgi:predicted ATPase/DNA-binding SARP family transcriptional activator
MLDEEPVTGFESDKVRALLAFLVVTPDQPHRREMLAGLLWPEYPERSARASLRNALANLRRTIGDHQALTPFLHVTRSTIQFSSESDHWLDVAAFTAPLAAPRPASEELEEAVAHYRGAFLEGFSTPDSAAFEEWLLFKREELGQQALEALQLLIETYEDRGAPDRALVHLRRWLELEPWQEEGHRELMRLLALSGRRSEALAQYGRCRQLLEDELGVEPSPETQALHQAILTGELTPAPEDQPAGRETGVSRSPVPLFNLPAQPTPFVGRERELSRLLELMADPEVRALTIVGPGGMGKTRLALEAGALTARPQHDASDMETAPAFAHGVVFVPLAPLCSSDEILPAVAEALQVRMERGEEQLFPFLRQKQLLLILDNLEHLEEAASLVGQILGAAPAVKVLTTSRERLQLRGEQVFPIQGLAFPEHDPDLATVDVDAHVEAYPAVRLLYGSAHRVQPTFAANPENLLTLARICRAVEGMPLALELAAGWADTLSLDDILAEIRQSLDFLETEWRDLPRRQRSMRAVFDGSWQRLSPAERALFSQLSVFRGGFTRTAAEQVAIGDIEGAALPRTLSRLVSKSFIQHDQAQDRYQIHELLRQYGAERLAQDPGCEAEAGDRHSRYYCEWMSGQEADLKGPRQQSAVAAIKAEIDNVRRACDWAASRGRSRRLGQVLGALGPFYRWQNCQAGESVFGTLAERLSAAQSPGQPISAVAQRSLARVLMWQSTYSGLLGAYEQSRQQAHRCLALLNTQPLADQDTRPEQAHAHWQLGHVLRYNNTEAARKSLALSSCLFEEVGDRWGQAGALAGLGRAARNLRDFDAAEAALTESLALRRAIGDNAGSAEALALLGHIAWYQAQFAEAEGLIRQSLALTQEPDLEGAARGLFHLGMTQYLSGQLAEARGSMAESVALYTDLGIRLMSVTGTTISAQILRHLGDYDGARAGAERALSAAREVAFELGVGWALGLLGAIALAEGDYGQAHERSEESLAVFKKQAGTRSPLEAHLPNLGLACRGLGQREEARHYFLIQLRRAEERWPLPPLLSALSGLALLLADAGQEERAVEIYALAARHPHVAKSRWFKDVAGAEMATVADRLPPQAAKAAQARGQAADLGQVVDELLETEKEQHGPDELT